LMQANGNVCGSSLSLKAGISEIMVTHQMGAM